MSGEFPASVYKKKLKFSASFKGNRHVKAFKKTQRLKVVTPPTVAPPAPPAPVGPVIPPVPNPQVHEKGQWRSNTSTSGPASNYYQFYINADDTISMFDKYNTFYWNCTPGGLTQGGISYVHTMHVVGDQVNDTYTYEDASIDTTIHYSLSVTFTGPESGIGHFEAAGGSSAIQCSVSSDFPVFRTGP